MCLCFVSSWNNLWDQERFGVMFSVFCHTSAPCLYVYDGFSSAIFESDVFSHHFLTYFKLKRAFTLSSDVFLPCGSASTSPLFLDNEYENAVHPVCYNMVPAENKSTWVQHKVVDRIHCCECSFNFDLHLLCLVGWDGMYVCLLPLFHLLAWQSAPMFLSAGTSTSRSPVQYSNTRMTSQIALIGYCANSTLL